MSKVYLRTTQIQKNKKNWIFKLSFIQCTMARMDPVAGLISKKLPILASREDSYNECLILGGLMVSPGFGSHSSLFYRAVSTS